jgi:hypothetical protein
MRTRTGKLYFFTGLLIILLSAGCAKYEDGPSFSLASKKARLTGNWKVTKFDAMDVATPYYHDFKSDGTYKRTITILGSDIIYTGTWEFTSNKEVVTLKIQGAYEEMVITRLTDDEFWYKDTDGKVWELVKQ